MGKVVLFSLLFVFYLVLNFDSVSSTLQRSGYYGRSGGSLGYSSGYSSGSKFSQRSSSHSQDNGDYGDDDSDSLTDYGDLNPRGDGSSNELILNQKASRSSGGIGTNGGVVHRTTTTWSSTGGKGGGGGALDCLSALCKGAFGNLGLNGGKESGWVSGSSWSSQSRVSHASSSSQQQSNLGGLEIPQIPKIPLNIPNILNESEVESLFNALNQSRITTSGSPLIPGQTYYYRRSYNWTSTGGNGGLRPITICRSTSSSSTAICNQTTIIRNVNQKGIVGGGQDRPSSNLGSVLNLGSSSNRNVHGTHSQGQVHTDSSVYTDRTDSNLDLQQQQTEIRPEYRPTQPEQRPEYRPTQPEQRPEQRPEYRPSQPEQRPEYRPEQRPEQRPEYRPEQRPEQRPEYRPEQRPEQRPEYRPEQRPEQRPEYRPEQRPEQRPEYRPEQRPEQRPEYRPTQPEQRPEQRPEYRPEQRPEQRPEYRPEQRPEQRPEYRTERPEQRPEYRPEQRPEYRPEQRPEYRPEQRPEQRPEYRTERPEQRPEYRPTQPEQRPEYQSTRRQSSVTHGHGRVQQTHNTQQQQQVNYGTAGRSPQRQPDSTRPEVTCVNGLIRGQIITTATGKEVYAFYGIPFAKAPVDELRFKRPEPIGSWDEPVIATTLPSACYQINTTIFPGNPGEEQWNPASVSEDCLYLNIWIPATVFRNREQSLESVLFWIYGGGYFSGSASLDIYDGAILAVEREIIVVSCQYRVGPLGFLYLDQEAPGNAGLLDQNMALRWVSTNIRYFGGNKDEITLIGESAGAASITLHLVSPLSKNLFNRAIIMSGLGYGWGVSSTQEAEKYSTQLAQLVGCDTSRGPAETVSCLRRVNAETLTVAQYRLFDKEVLGFPFTPVVDGHFLPSCPMKLGAQNTKRTDVIVGTVKDEATYFLLYQYMALLAGQHRPDFTNDKLSDILNRVFVNRRSAGEVETIVDYYTNWKNPRDGQENLQRLKDALGDAFFICPSRSFADIWSSHSLVYQYHFTQRTSSNPWPEWTGVMHADDIQYVFGVPLREPERFTQEEQQLSILMMESLTNFAKTGVPSTRWERYTEEKPTYLDFNATILSDETSEFTLGPRADACTLWNRILPRISCSLSSQSPTPENLGSRDLCQVLERSSTSSNIRRTSVRSGNTRCTTRTKGRQSC